MVGARLCTMGSRVKYRHTLVQDLTFPTECPDWTDKSGCTRISIYEQGCVDTGNLTNYRNTFNLTQPEALNSKIAECLGKSVPGKIQYPPLLDAATEWQPIIHVTWSSEYIGSIEDMFIETYLNDTANPTYAVVNIQSQLRLHGSSGYYDHTNWLLRCMNNNLKEAVNTYLAPCSL